MLRVLTLSICIIVATAFLTESSSVSAKQARPAKEVSDKKRASLPIVYSWSERSTGTANINGYEVTALDTYDPLPDVNFIFSGFKEANVVDRDADGVETTLFDCIGNDELHCAALDPRVSPDNKKIAFAVVYAKQIIPNGRWTIHGVMPIPVLGGTHSAQIFIYDVETKQLTGWPLVQGVIDMHPEWISNDRLVFVSNRSKVYPLYLPGLSPTYKENYALQRWQANIDGSDAVNIGPHDDMALHPLVLSDGNIIASTWRLDEKLSLKVTPQNQYWITETDQFGGNETSMLGAHGTLFAEGGKTNSLIALHFLGERSNGDIMVADYYRGRHMGLGMPIGFPRLPHGVEGVGSGFLPAIYSILPWAQEEDNPTLRDDQGYFMGNGGYPSGLPKGRIMITKGTGYCYEGLPPQKANAEYLKGPGCDTGIYMVNKMPSAHPDDLIKIVDDPTRHEFSADVRLPYSATYGKAMPTQQVREDQGFCSLNVVNIYVSHMNEGSPACSKKGLCINEGYTMSDLRRLAIYEAHPNSKPQRTLKGIPLEGHEMTLLGYAIPEADGSVNVRIPCDTPYKLRGVASDGVEFVRDQIKHSNRPGEARRCLGCHAGHTMSDYQPDLPGLFANTIAGSRPAKALERK